MANTDPFNMCRGIAVGGPRNNAVIEASYRWNGRIRKPSKSAEIKFYPGKYVYMLDLRSWEWVPDSE